MQSSDPLVALITGGNRGLGLQTARELGRRGIKVILGVRDPARGEAAVAELRAEGIAAEAWRVDLSDPSTNWELYDTLVFLFGRLDILVNNAAIWLDDAPGKISLPGGNVTSTLPMEFLRATFETNFFGTVALTQLLLPLLLRKSAAGRIVNVSSIQASLTLHSDPAAPIYPYKAFAYDASKTALNAFTVHLAHELRDTAIKVNSAHPGWVKTEMGGPDAPMELKDGARTSAWLATLDADGPTGGFFHLKDALPW